MLTESERHEIEAEVSRSFDRRGACIGALRMVQARRGWVPEEALAEVAEMLGMTTDEVEGVATFYNLIFRLPVGRHVLKVCDGAVCWMLGGETLMQHLERKLGIEVGQTTADGEFTLLPICCLGDCDHAPVMLFDDVLVRDLTPERINQVLAAGPEEQ